MMCFLEGIYELAVTPSHKQAINAFLLYVYEVNNALL